MKIVDLEKIKMSFFCLISEVSYPDDIINAEDVPIDAATAVQPEVVDVLVPPVSLPQVDRTRKPAANQKPESPVIEIKEFPVKPVRRFSSSSKNNLYFSKPEPEQPQIPDRTTKPVPPPTEFVFKQLILKYKSILHFRPIPPVSQETPPIPSRPIQLPEATPKPILSNATKNDPNQENVAPKSLVPARDTLSIYRPFNRVTPIDTPNNQYQKGFDAVTGRLVQKKLNFKNKIHKKTNCLFSAERFSTIRKTIELLQIFLKMNFLSQAFLRLIARVNLC